MAEWKRQVSWRFRAWHFSIGEMGRPLTNPSASLVLSTRIDLARSRSAAKENLLPRYVINPPLSMAGMGTPLIVKDGWICWYFPDRCAAAYAKDLSGRIMRSAQAVHL